mmetsp:Transcript_65639/g.189234  ORF Transcript_65639/g.189234 Transcript_65639/m.189234 type:complete len:225 (-) Transcript_65639:217-891(-)
MDEEHLRLERFLLAERHGNIAEGLWHTMPIGNDNARLRQEADTRPLHRLRAAGLRPVHDDIRRQLARGPEDDQPQARRASRPSVRGAWGPWLGHGRLAERDGLALPSEGAIGGGALSPDRERRQEVRHLEHLARPSCDALCLADVAALKVGVVTDRAEGLGQLLDTTHRLPGNISQDGAVWHLWPEDKAALRRHYPAAQRNLQVPGSRVCDVLEHAATALEECT